MRLHYPAHGLSSYRTRAIPVKELREELASSDNRVLYKIIDRADDHFQLFAIDFQDVSVEDEAFVDRKFITTNPGSIWL